MFNPDGSYSDEYNTMLRYLKTQIDKAVKENAGITEIARTKRRYNSFKGNMVDFLVGGVTLADREALKTAVEAVKFYFENGIEKAQNKYN